MAIVSFLFHIISKGGIQLTKAMRLSLLFLAVTVAASLLFAQPKTEAEAEREDISYDVLILYDDSFAARMDNNNLSNPASRLRQMAKLASIPFKETLGVSLNYTVASYSSVLGTEYAKSCPYLYPLISNDGEFRPYHQWALDAQCECYLDSECYLGDYDTCHHNSAIGLLDRLTEHAPNSGYDYVAGFVGHTLCYYSNEHHYCAGMAYAGEDALVGIGYADMSLGQYKVLNILSMKGIYWHEFSHNLGLHDPEEDYTSTEPCTMAGGFDGIIYARNIWCSNCLNALAASGGDTLE